MEKKFYILHQISKEDYLHLIKKHNPDLTESESKWIDTSSGGAVRIGDRRWAGYTEAEEPINVAWEEVPKPNVCRVCGCTDLVGCTPSCFWMNKEKTLCSACILKADKTISFKDRPEKLKSAQDLYELYNGFLQDIISKAVAVTPEEQETVELIREEYNEVWKHLDTKEYNSIYEFEAEATTLLEILEDDEE